MIKKLGFSSMSFGLTEINDGFQAVKNKQKMKKLEEDKQYEELDKLKKLESGARKEQK